MNLASYIDHTFLKPDGDEKAIYKLCREAKKYGFASVCVNPAEVKLAAKLLKKSNVKVCTVVGFPLGANSTSIKLAEALQAVEEGANELDFVLNQRLLKYNVAACLYELEILIDACRAIPKMMKHREITAPLTKLIIECCNLTREEKILACKLAKKAGFDYVKTSTGFAKGGATVEDVKLMRKVVGPKMGVKAAGGIRDRETALKMIAAGATRLGCSAGVEICK